MTTRRDKLTAIMALPTYEERLATYLALQAEEMRSEPRNVVVMCTCLDWETCAHPYPEIIPTFEQFHRARESANSGAIMPAPTGGEQSQ